IALQQGAIGQLVGQRARHPQQQRQGYRRTTFISVFLSLPAPNAFATAPVKIPHPAASRLASQHEPPGRFLLCLALIRRRWPGTIHARQGNRHRR
ncbi:hypothetical protein V2A07_20390, partial [Pseudomonas aeruginosa]